MGGHLKTEVEQSQGFGAVHSKLAERSIVARHLTRPKTKLMFVNVFIRIHVKTT